MTDSQVIFLGAIKAAASMMTDDDVAGGPQATADQFGRYLSTTIPMCRQYFDYAVKQGQLKPSEPEDEVQPKGEGLKGVIEAIPGVISAVKSVT